MKQTPEMMKYLVLTTRKVESFFYKKTKIMRL